VVRLTSSNAYSDGEVEMPLRDYLEGLNRGRMGNNGSHFEEREECSDASSELMNDGVGPEASCLATARPANESVYLFGGNYSPGW
jgi:hypothetical protein